MTGHSVWKEYCFILQKISNFKYYNLLQNKLGIKIFHFLNKKLLHLIIIPVSCLYVHWHEPNIWHLIVKIMFQMQTHELNPLLKSNYHTITTRTAHLYSIYFLFCKQMVCKNSLSLLDNLRDNLSNWLHPFITYINIIC